MANTSTDIEESSIKTPLPPWVEAGAKIGQVLVVVAVLCYSAGSLITNVYLGALGITTFDILRARYILVGALFLGCMAFLVGSLALLVRQVIYVTEKQFFFRVGYALNFSLLIFILLFILFCVFTLLAPDPVTEPRSTLPVQPTSDILLWLWRIAYPPVVMALAIVLGAVVFGIAIVIIAAAAEQVRRLGDFLYAHYWRQFLVVTLALFITYLLLAVLVDDSLALGISVLIYILFVLYIIYIDQRRLKSKVPGNSTSPAPPTPAPTAASTVAATTPPTPAATTPPTPAATAAGATTTQLAGAKTTKLQWYKSPLDDVFQTMKYAPINAGIVFLVVLTINVLYSIKERSLVFLAGVDIRLDAGWWQLLALIGAPYLLFMSVFLAGYKLLNSGNSRQSTSKATEPSGVAAGSPIQPPPNPVLPPPNPVLRANAKYLLWGMALVLVPGMFVPVYALGVYENLPQQFGGGRPTRVQEIVGTDSEKFTLSAAPDSKEIELLDRTSSGSLLVRVTITGTQTQPVQNVLEIPYSEVLGITYTTRIKDR